VRAKSTNHVQHDMQSVSYTFCIFFLS